MAGYAPSLSYSTPLSTIDATCQTHLGCSAAEVALSERGLWRCDVNRGGRGRRYYGAGVVVFGHEAGGEERFEVWTAKSGETRRGSAQHESSQECLSMGRSASRRNEVDVM